MSNPFPDTDPVLVGENLYKKFGTVKAVDGLCLPVRGGEVLALLGPNGAGKTVTISMLCGLLKPDRGRVLYQGHPVNRTFKRVIGLCPQKLVVWPKQTCLEQLTFMGEMYGLTAALCRRRAEMLLSDLGLSEKRRQIAATLSGGMQRRLNLALALMHDPELLILDEPEAGLDPQSRVLVREYIRSWITAGQRTVILSTHNMDEADRLADKVAILDHGRILKLDTPAALKRQAGEGDVLEISASGDLSTCVRTLQSLRAVAPEAELENHTFRIRRPGVLEVLPEILRIIASTGLGFSDIRLRNNTLEDVFIALTGRRLRE